MPSITEPVWQQRCGPLTAQGLLLLLQCLDMVTGVLPGEFSFGVEKVCVCMCKQEAGRKNAFETLSVLTW